MSERQIDKLAEIINLLKKHGCLDSLRKDELLMPPIPALLQKGYQNNMPELKKLLRDIEEFEKNTDDVMAKLRSKYASADETAPSSFGSPQNKTQLEVLGLDGLNQAIQKDEH